jgi:hypothetical protein
VNERDDRRVSSGPEASITRTGDNSPVRLPEPPLRRVLALVRPRAGVAPKSQAETFWQRWGREVANRLEDWKFGLMGFIGPALLTAIIVSPVAGVLYAAVVTALVLSWSVMATWIAQRDEARAALRADEGARKPALIFGVAEIPLRAQPIGYGGIVANEHGRIIRVPVSNALGAGEALRVHARIRFQAGNTDNGYEPFETQGEWVGEVEGREIAIDFVGNGQPRKLDIALVRNSEYPYLYEWTERSRAAFLRGYGVEATPVEVLLEVQGLDVDGEPVRLSDSLLIECRPGDAISADWISTLGRVATNLVTWPKWRPGGP